MPLDSERFMQSPRTIPAENSVPMVDRELGIIAQDSEERSPARCSSHYHLSVHTTIAMDHSP